jgi:hypothetical protein
MDRQAIAHDSFEPDGAEAVQFKRSTARKKLQEVDPRWTKDKFENSYRKLQEHEANLKKMVDEIDADRWVSALFTSPPGLPAHLTQFSDPGWLARISSIDPPSEK